jgi:hypothetical protein
MADFDQVPREAIDWDAAPGVLEGSTSYELRPEQCGIEFWLKEVAQGPLVGLEHGRRPESEVPDFLREPGPLRDNLIREFAFRSETERAATWTCALICAAARRIEDVAGMEFYATQALDEARHSESFRHHLVDLGVPEDELLETVKRVAGDDARRLVEPVWDWGVPRYAHDYIKGVVIVTILLEGVLAPTTELSEHKWRPISPATADIERGACVDEIRHLTVGSWIIRDHVQKHPEDKEELLDLIREGRDVWASLPVPEIIFEREQQYQDGIQSVRDQIADAEITPGVRLVDTTPEDRLGMAVGWAKEVQESRLKYMGLEDAIPQEARAI